ncbi:MAG TPA: lactonase family protein [Terriglobales bacterium]
MKNILLLCAPALILLITAALASADGPAKTKHKNYVLFVGTYTKNESKGIYAYRYDGVSGQLKSLGLAAETSNPSFLTVDRAGKFLYAVNEDGTYKGEASGGLSSFAIDHKTGKLAQINQVSSHGADPCYISLDRSGKFLLVANYTGGTVAVFPVLPDGHIGEASSVVKDAGALGPNKERQDAPHAHWIETSARNRFAYVADLGLDRVLIYKFDAKTGKLTEGSATASGTPTTKPRADDFFSATLAPGTGPRHVAFSADGNFMYVLGELDSTVTVFANDDKETFRSIQKISALPGGFSGKNDAAEIAMHPSGKFLYTSNRGDDSIAVFSVAPGTGQLSVVGTFPAGGKAPRNFVIDPAGTHLLVANQETGNIVVFSIDPASGRLTPTGQIAKTGSPVCLVFLAVD